jgi:hypothetical protein
MADPTVLILDDEEKWLALHERRLTQAGLTFRSTQLAREAIDIAKAFSTVKFALIDEILYVPPVPIATEQREFQRWQGSGVIREITAQRSDIQFIIVTSAPLLTSKGDNQSFRQETAKLRRQRGVIDIIHKQDIDEDPNGSYGWLIDLLKRPQLPTPTETAQPRVLVGIGVSADILDGAKYKRLRSCLKDLGASEFELDTSVERFLSQLKATEKTILIETPGSKKFDRCPQIKSNSQTFRILEFLARRTEQRTEVIVREQDYQYSSRKTIKGIDTTSELDQRSVQDFAFGYADDGRKRLQSGVQIEGKAEQNSRLKVAIHRVSQQLDKLNVGPARQLFNFEQNGYRPTFETGIILYTTDTKKFSSR